MEESFSSGIRFARQRRSRGAGASGERASSRAGSLRGLLPVDRAGAAAERARRPLAAGRQGLSRQEGCDSMLIRTSLLVAAAMCAATVATAQSPPAQGGTAQTATSPGKDGKDAKDEGIRSRASWCAPECGGCHRSRRQDADVAHLVPPRQPENWERTIKRMVSAQPRQPRAGRRARHPQVPGRSPRPRARRSAADRVRGRAADDRLHLRRRQGHRRTPARRATRSARVLSERRTKEEWGLLVACTAATTRSSTTSR